MIGIGLDLLGSAGGGQLQALNSEHSAWLGRRNFDHTLKRGRQLGLTPQEVWGAPAPGGVSGPSPTNILGNGSNLQQDKQLAFQADQKDKDRATQLGIAQIQADTALRGQDINQGLETRKLDLQQVMNASQIKQIEAQTQNILQQTKIDWTTFQERWPRLLATVGPDNVITSLLAALAGVDVQKLLNLQGQALPPDQLAAFENMLNEAVKIQSTVFKEYHGGKAVVEESVPHDSNSAMKFVGGEVLKMNNTLGKAIRSPFEKVSEFVVDFLSNPPKPPKGDASP